MLYLTVPETEAYDEEKNEFVILNKEQRIQLEHSLVSLSKWESKWKTPYLEKTKDTITEEQSIDYIRCMTITQNVPQGVYDAILSNPSLMSKIQEYIDDPMTATWFSDDAKNGKHGMPGRQIITSELVYYWMLSFNIPFECEKWHLNRLMTLIRVCSVKQQPSKKMSAKEIAERNSRLNAQRLAKLKTKG